MATLNKVTLIGYLGRDPEKRVTGNGDAVAQFTLATTETWKDKATGERRQATEWHRIVLYRKLADIALEYLKKGSLVYVEGRLHTRKWTGKDDVERTTVEIVADDMRMLGARSHDHDSDSEAPHADSREHAHAADTGATGASRYDLMDDAIPF